MLYIYLPLCPRLCLRLLMLRPMLRPMLMPIVPIRPCAYAYAYVYAYAFAYTPMLAPLSYYVYYEAIPAGTGMEKAGLSEACGVGGTRQQPQVFERHLGASIWTSRGIILALVVGTPWSTS